MKKLHSLFIMLALFAGIHQAAAQGTTAFTYQGQLHDNGTNANGAYTMIFALYNAATGGTQIGSTITTSPTLANGLFTVNLDFGAGAFTGAARFLDITVDSQELTPRVQVLPTPYAQFAGVAGTVTNGAIMNAQIANGAVTAANISGAVTSAASLTNENWNVSVGTFNGYANSFGIFYTNGLMMGMTANGDVVLVPYNGNFTVGIIPGELGIHGDIDMNGGPIYDLTELDSQNGDITIGGNVTVTGNLIVNGALNCVPQMQVFTTNGTFVVPANVTTIMVELWGGGGGGGDGWADAYGDCTEGGGGGAGGYAKGVESVNPGATYMVTVGSGGAGGPLPISGSADGSPGGASTFGESSNPTGFVTALGGAPGTGGTINGSGNPGQGGTASAFGIRIQGGNGLYSTGQGGIGGAAGCGGSGGVGTIVGQSPGGGGGGSPCGDSGGGNGGNGQVVIYY